LVRSECARAVASLAEHLDQQLMRGLTIRLDSDEALGGQTRGTGVACLCLRTGRELQCGRVVCLELLTDLLHPLTLMTGEERDSSKGRDARRRTRRSQPVASLDSRPCIHQSFARVVDVDGDVRREAQLIATPSAGDQLAPRKARL